MKSPIIKLCFKEKLNANTYLFDVLARKNTEEYPTNVGIISANVKTEQAVISINMKEDISEDYDTLRLTAINSANCIIELMEG